MNTLGSDCFEEWRRNLLDRWRSTLKIGEAQLRSDLFNTRLKYTIFRNVAITQGFKLLETSLNNRAAYADY